MCVICFVPGQIPEPDEVMPEFYAPLENWTVTQGRDVYFTCTVNNLGKYKVSSKTGDRSNDITFLVNVSIFPWQIEIKNHWREKKKMSRYFIESQVGR